MTTIYLIFIENNSVKLQSSDFLTKLGLIRIACSNKMCFFFLVWSVNFIKIGSETLIFFKCEKVSSVGQRVWRSSFIHYAVTRDTTVCGAANIQQNMLVTYENLFYIILFDKFSQKVQKALDIRRQHEF